MQRIKEEIINSVLGPKREQLLDRLHLLVSGRLNSYAPDIENPQYYEIWFYSIFDFNYTVIGRENYTIELANSKDESLLSSILIKYRNLDELSEEAIEQIKKDCEFNFFSDCWDELEQTSNRNIRGFLIEHGIIRGWDLNRRKLVEGEEIGDILNREGIPNTH